MWDHCQYKDLSSFIICLFRSRPRLLQESSSTPVEAPLWTVARCPATWRPSTRWRTWAWPWLRSGALTTPSTPLLMLWTSWFLASSSVSTQSLLLALEPSQVDSNKVRNYLSTLIMLRKLEVRVQAWCGHGDRWPRPGTLCSQRLRCHGSQWLAGWIPGEYYPLIGWYKYYSALISWSKLILYCDWLK